MKVKDMGKEWIFMTLGKRIKSLRESRNWSQKDLAAAIEESRQSVQRWEKDQSLPELDRVIHLSMLFEIPLTELLGDQAGAYDLEGREDPFRDRQKRRKEKILLGLKLLAVGIMLLIAVLINLVWFRFLHRFL